MDPRRLRGGKYDGSSAPLLSTHARGIRGARSSAAPRALGHGALSTPSLGRSPELHFLAACASSPLRAPAA